jgi:hypothetical protein
MHCFIPDISKAAAVTETTPVTQTTKGIVNENDKTSCLFAF